MYAKGFKLFFCANIVEKTKYNCFAFCLNYVRLLCTNFIRQYIFLQ
jgi:hypothetical protein